MSDESYLLDNRAEETGQRFDSLAALFNPVTFRHMEQLGLGDGWRCLEVGAGGDSVARWLSDRVGPKGQVVATDLEPRWLAGLDLPNVEVRRHDIAAEALEEDEFDLVHARLVLVHVPGRLEALRKMVRALRPGGRLLLEDFDGGLIAPASLDPRTAGEHLANKVRAAFIALLEAGGVDLEFGRKLPRLLEDEGLVDIGADGHLTVRGGEALRLMEAANTLQVREPMVAQGLVSKSELAHYLELLHTSDLELATPPLISAWGRRPG